MNLCWFILIFPFIIGCTHLPQAELGPQSLSLIPRESRQLIVVYSSPKGTFLSGMAKEEAWTPVLAPIPVNIGRNGFAEPNHKKEGDGKTPTGLYKIGTSFGYHPEAQTGLDYKQVFEDDFWIDDPESAQYNRWVKGVPQAKSFERLKRNDNLYEYGIVIEYNTNPVVPGAGSAIFIHLWRGENKPTAGCVSMSKKNIIKLRRWLDRNQNPYIWLNPIH